MGNPVVRNATPLARPETVKHDWWLVDADGQTLGRLAARIAMMLMGKHKPVYTPHVDTGDAVVVVNVEKIKLSGNKSDQKEYRHYSGYPSGLKGLSMSDMMRKNPVNVLKLAVKRMLPKNKLGRKMFKKLWVYVGADHPHTAQRPQPWDGLWIKSRMER
ncbi:MAG: 50S ribosomal protein L13 [Planctomycetes bacterium]|nr:50S ribosomal protein L13 [Planctomycetota bacterium]